MLLLTVLAAAFSCTALCTSSSSASTEKLASALSPLTYSAPAASISVCEGEVLSIDLNISGTAPYTLFFQVTDLETSITEPTQSIVLNDLENWELTPNGSAIYVITEITDSAPTPCSLTPMDSMEVTVEPATVVSMLVEPYSCLNEMAFIDFKFESFSGPTFDITYSTQPDGEPLLTSTISNIDESVIASDSTYTQLVSFSFNTNTTFSLVGAVDSGNGCVVLNPSSPLEMEVAPVPTASISGMGSACPEESLDMTLELAGISPWQVVIDRPIGADSTLIITASPFIFSDSEVGIYTLMSVQDSIGCTGTVSGSAELTPLNLPSAALAGSGVLCSGQAAEIELEFLGTGPFDVTITDPNSQDILIQSGLAAGDSLFNASLSGDYVVSSISNSECTNSTPSDVFTLTEVSVPEVSLTGADFICNADSTLLFISITNGTTPFDITLENADAFQTISLNVTDFLDSIYVHSAGEYDLSGITDANSCSGSASNSLELTERSLPAADAGVDEDRCNGTEIILGSSSDPALTYEWTSNNADILDISTLPQPSILLQHASNADYELEVYLKTSDGFCANSDTKNITIHPSPEVSAGSDQTACFQENVELNGSGEGTLTWSNNGNLSDYSVANPTLLNAQETDTFVLTVESAINTGCTAMDSVTITIQPEIILSMSYTPEVCFDECGGELTFQVSGGQGVLDTSLRNSADDEINATDFEALCADSYTLTVTDENLCMLDSILVISELPEYVISDVNTINPVCFGDETGEITVTALDALQYSILPDPTQASPIFSGLSAGFYEVQVMNTQGCLADSTIELTSNPEFTLSTNFTSMTACYGDLVGLQATANGGIGNHTFSWLPSSAPFDTDAGSVNLNINEDLMVQVFASDESGECTTDTLSMEVLLPPAISAGLVSDTLTICRDDELVLSSNPSGGTGTLACVWSAAGMGDIPDCNATVSPLTTTNYTLTISDGCSLPLTEEVTVVVNQLPMPEFTLSETAGCVPLAVDLINTSIGVTSETCTWNLGDGSQEINSCGDVSHLFYNYGEFMPSLTLTTAEDCSATFSPAAPISVYELPLVDFSWSPNPVTILDTEVQFFNETYGGEDYEWESEGMFSSSEVNPEFEFPPNVSAIYTVCLTAQSQFGCESDMCREVEIESTVSVHIPNAFSPDGDGYNEEFTPITNGVSEDNYNFRVFSRQGTIVFESNIPNEGWDGSFQNSDFFSPDGVYTWVLNVKGLDSSEVSTYRGQVTVLR